MEKFLGIIMIAIITEGLITYFKTIVVERQIQWQLVASMGVGVLITLIYQIDLLAVFGLVSMIPFMGCILTGIFISRGSNYMFDLITKLQGGFRNNAETNTTNQ